MDWQPYINIAFGSVLAVIGSVSGWFARQVWGAVQDLKRDLKDLEVKLPVEYVRKDDLSEMMGRIYQILDRIERKLDSKADK
jgi:hypothetical protein